MSIWNPKDGRYASMMHKIFVADFSVCRTTRGFTRRRLEVQIEKCHLQSMRVHGERQFQEAPMQHPQEVIEEMTRARMPVTRVCVYHVDNVSAGKSHAFTGEIFAHMLFECVCHQVSIVGGDANKLAYQKSGTQLNSSYNMSTCQPWTDRMEQTLGYYLKNVLQTNGHERQTVPLHFLS